MSACPFCAYTTGHHHTCLAKPRPETVFTDAVVSSLVSAIAPHHDGATLEPSDHARLNTQQERVRSLMADGRWWTLRDLAEKVGASEAGVSARVRDLRKARFGGFVVERRREGNLHLYRISPASTERAA